MTAIWLQRPSCEVSDARSFTRVGGAVTLCHPPFLFGWMDSHKYLLLTVLTEEINNCQFADERSGWLAGL